MNQPVNAEGVRADLSLLWQAARISPHLRVAVERVEAEIQRLVGLLDESFVYLPESPLRDDVADAVEAHR